MKMYILKLWETINSYDLVEMPVVVSESKELLVQYHSENCKGYVLLDRIEYPHDTLETYSKRVGKDYRWDGSYHSLEEIECLK